LMPIVLAASRSAALWFKFETRSLFP
jgi:hypothetical protein